MSDNRRRMIGAYCVVADDRHEDDVRHRLAGIKDLWTDLKSAKTSTHSGALMDSCDEQRIAFWRRSCPRRAAAMTIGVRRD